jgi:hypothetical protein
MITKYSNWNKVELDKELIINKRKYDLSSKSLNAQSRLLNNSKDKQIGRIRSCERLIEKYSSLVEKSKENLGDLYYEYLGFKRNGQIPELVENSNKSTTNFLKEYKNLSGEVKAVWDKYKRIPKLGTPEGNLRHKNIEKMKNIEKEIYKRIFNYEKN